MQGFRSLRARQFRIEVSNLYDVVEIAATFFLNETSAESMPRSSREDKNAK